MACPSKPLRRPLAGFPPSGVPDKGEGRDCRPESPLRVCRRLPRLRPASGEVFRDNSAGGSCAGEGAALAGDVGVEQGEEIRLQPGANRDALAGGRWASPLTLA